MFVVWRSPPSFLVFTRLTSPVERSHLIEYGVVVVLVYAPLTERARHWRSVPVSALVAVAATVVIGTFDELIQVAFPNRVFELHRNRVQHRRQAVMAVAAAAALARARRRRLQRVPERDG